MSRKSTSSVKKLLINFFRFLHILISFGHKLRKQLTLFFVNLVKLTSKFRDGVTGLGLCFFWFSSSFFFFNFAFRVKYLWLSSIFYSFGAILHQYISFPFSSSMLRFLCSCVKPSHFSKCSCVSILMFSSQYLQPIWSINTDDLFSFILRVMRLLCLNHMRVSLSDILQM